MGVLVLIKELLQAENEIHFNWQLKVSFEVILCNKKKQMVTFEGLKNIAEILNQILQSDCHDPVFWDKKNHVNLIFFIWPWNSISVSQKVTRP